MTCVFVFVMMTEKEKTLQLNLKGGKLHTPSHHGRGARKVVCESQDITETFGHKRQEVSSQELQTMFCRKGCDSDHY